MADYASSAEADTYFATRLNASPWDDASSGNKAKAVTHATAIIDRLNFLGEKTVSTQANQFPRNDDTTIPQDIQDACCEIAKALLDGVDPEIEIENLSMTQMQYGPAKTSYDRSRLPEHIAHGVPSGVAWRLLKPYLRDASAVTLMRVD